MLAVPSLRPRILLAFGLLYVFPIASTASSCSSPIQPTKSIKPSVAQGYTWAVVATGLTSPRSLEFDSKGNLLVLEAGKGLSSHVVHDGGGTCLSFSSSKDVFDDPELNHGLALSHDGRTVYVSTFDKVYSFAYNASQSSADTSTNTTLVFGMSGQDHTTRTLLIPQTVHGQLVVSRGSSANIDPLASNKSTGHSTIKSFNLTDVPKGGYEHNTTGTLLGWGLRNDVGVAEHPNTGGIWAVENSVDQLSRNGKDVHIDNPGEELNFLGYLNGTKGQSESSNFGYPECFTAWKPGELTANANLVVGTPFATKSSDDAACGNTTAPRLTWQAHTAPIDMKFNNSATEAWVSFHGSWNRQDPVGYSVALVSFTDGDPTQPSTSSDSAHTIFANVDNSVCPGNCFRPAGMVFDSKGRLYVASDASGEVYVVVKQEEANATVPSGSGSGGSGATAGSAPTWGLILLLTGWVMAGLL